MKVASNGTKNLIPQNQRTKEEQKRIAKMGGIASGEARREKATMRKMLEMCLEMKNSEGQTYRELATLGLIKGAVNGDSRNYKVMLEALGELSSGAEEKQQQELSKLDAILIEIKNEANK